MYVCLCNNITDRAIRQSVREGASTLPELRKSLGVASQCGQCACMAQEIIEETLQTNPPSLGFSLPYAAA